MSKKQPTKILAIDPGTRYLGVAVLENRELIYWAVKTINQRSNPRELLAEAKKIIGNLLKFYQPDIIVQEKAFFSQSKNSDNLTKLSNLIKRLAQKHNLTHLQIAPNTVRKQICQNGWATKRETAKIIVSLYPELSINLTQDRVWKEKHWGHMFDAVALGLCCLTKISNGKPAKFS